jgi:hypothetical protein
MVTEVYRHPGALPSAGTGELYSQHGVLPPEGTQAMTTTDAYNKIIALLNS